MSVNYESEFKKKIVRLHLEEGRTFKSIQEKYGVLQRKSAQGPCKSVKAGLHCRFY